jgi:serine/threonine protein kinase
LDELSRSQPGELIQEANKEIAVQAESPSLKPAAFVSTTDRTEQMSESFRVTASEAARKVIAERMSNSKVSSELAILEIPEFDINELALGKRLGKGGFSSVDEIQAILLRSSNGKTPSRSCRRRDSFAVDDKESRQFIADHCKRASGDSRYALKTLRRDVVNDEERLVLGLCDLAVEVRFLSALTHPHIIKLRAVSSASEYSSDFFLILDRLYDTLAKRLLQWRVRKNRLKTVLGRLIDRKGVKSLEFYEDRIERAYDLSSALEYCHEKNIIHRDIVSTSTNTEEMQNCEKFPIMSLNVLNLCFGGRLFVLQKPPNIGFDCVSSGIDDVGIHQKARRPAPRDLACD